MEVEIMDDIILPKESIQIEQTVENICSLKFGSPTKGGEVKVYFNPEDPEIALKRLVNSCQLNKVAQMLLQDPFNEQLLKQAKELILEKQKMDGKIETVSTTDPTEEEGIIEEDMGVVEDGESDNDTNA